MEQKQNVENEYSFADPTEVIEAVGIESGQKVADFGSGPGYFSLPIAKLVGENGHVYAFDVLPSALNTLESKVKLENIDNLTTIRANLEKRNSTELEDGTLDWIVLRNILYQTTHGDRILKEAYRVLKKGGQIVVMGWNNNLTLGPSVAERISKEKLGELIEQIGFERTGEFNAGDYHFVMIATK